MGQCTKDCIQIIGHLNPDDMCQYTQNSCVQDTVQFIQMYYCTFHSSFILLIFLGIPAMYILFRTLNNLADTYLSPCVDNFIVQFRISPALAGVTFLAFANGAPDVLTAILAGASDSDSTALIPFGSIFGAFLFSTAFILSTVILLQKSGKLEVKKKQILLPLAFYIVGMLYIFLVSLIYGKMNPYIASFLLVLYLVYIVITLIIERKNKKMLKETLLQMHNEPKITDETILTQEKEEQLSEDKSEQEELSFIEKLNNKIDGIETSLFCWLVPPSSEETWEPLKAVVSLFASPFVLALSQGIDSLFESRVGPFPTMVILALPAILLILNTLYCVSKDTKPSLMPAYTLYSFVVTIAWLTLVCGVLINLFELLQLLSDINTVFLGLTVFAWANCIGDYLTIVRFARIGNASTAVAGVFSGQLFNFLLGFGCSLILQSIDGEYSFQIFYIHGEIFEILSSSIVLLVLGAGFIYMVYVYTLVVRKRGILSPSDANIMRIYYFVFVIFAVVLAVLTDFYNPLQCDA